MWKQLVQLVTFVAISAAFGDARTNIQNLQKCLRFKGILPSNFVVRSNNSALYAQLNQPTQLKSPRTAPLAFVLVQSEADVIATVICCKSLSIRVVPKGGGHSFEKYSFGDPSSVVIDLRALDEVKVNRDRRTAIVGPGNLVTPLTWKLWSTAQVLIPVTVCPTVGISTGLGGGIGPFVGTYGLTLDQILEMRVVLANGSVVVTNYRKNSELYWALRGAGAASFGIVTQFVFRVFPAPRSIFEATLTFNITQFSRVMNIWQKLVAVDVTPSSVTTQMVITRTSFFLRFTDVSGSDFNFKKLGKLLPQTLTRVITLQSYPDYLFNLAKAGQSSEGLLDPSFSLTQPSDLGKINRPVDAVPAYSITKSFFVQKLVGMSEVTVLQAVVEELPDTISILLDNLGGYVRSIGVNETSFVHRGDNLYLIAAIYGDISPNTTSITTAQAFYKKFFDIGPLFYNSPETYQNYVDGDLPDFLQRYYGNSVDRLISVKRKYDPENFFTFPQSIPTELLKN